MSANHDMPPADARPPQWAETILRLSLTERDRDPVSGDLLEIRTLQRNNAGI